MTEWKKGQAFTYNLNDQKYKFCILGMKEYGSTENYQMKEGKGERNDSFNQINMMENTTAHHLPKFV